MKKIILFLLLSTSLIACTKTSVDTPNDFTVSVNSNTFSVNDTVVFNLTGNPDYITFYSGMPHNKYQFAADTLKQSDSTILIFSSLDSVLKGSIAQPVNVNFLYLLASNNFSGIMDSVNIKSAKWDTIQTKAMGAISGTENTSERIRIDTLGLTTGSKPLYLAFQYVSDTIKKNYTPRIWTLSAFNLSNYFTDTSYILANSYTAAGFYQANVTNPFNSWSYGNVSSITQSLTFNASAVYPAIGSLPNEAWAISRPFNLSQYPSDLGLVIKNLGQSHLNTYKMTQTYKTAGTYLVTFVARNQYGNNYKTVVRQITLKITP